jgi:hypothetical protein
VYTLVLLPTTRFVKSLSHSIRCRDEDAPSYLLPVPVPGTGVLSSTGVTTRSASKEPSPIATIIHFGRFGWLLADIFMSWSNTAVRCSASTTDDRMPIASLPIL